MDWTKTNAMFVLVGIIGCSLSCMAESRAAVYRSPLAVAVSPDGKTVYVSDKTAKCVTVLDVAGNRSLSDIPIPNEPNGLALSADGKTLYVAERKAHAVAVIDTARGAVSGRIAVGLWPVAVALAEGEAALNVQPGRPHGLRGRPGGRQGDQADPGGARAFVCGGQSG
jgi:YVTN family beta-propeller protein